jgi:hypothetical protein
MISPNPLRLSNDRVWLYGAALVILGLLPLLLAPSIWKGDWAYFVGGGATVGTPDLLGPRHIAWEAAHHSSLALPWDYPPAVAWFLAPFAHISLGLGFWINATLMLGACIISSAIAATVYDLPLNFSALAVFSWAPAVASIWAGQNASLALLFCMICIFGLVRGRSMVAGAGVGLLLFKPTDAAVFILLLLLRREWRALAVVGAIAAAWYLASVAAAAGDWLWPYHYVAFMLAYYPHQQYSQFLISSSALAIRLGVPVLLANGVSAALLLTWCSITVRVSQLEAASFAGLIAVATSLHANPHEAALLIPSVFYVMTRVNEPWRTVIVAVAYGTATISVYFRAFIAPFDPVTLLVALSTLCYLAYRLWHPVEHNRMKRPLTA